LERQLATPKSIDINKRVEGHQQKRLNHSHKHVMSRGHVVKNIQPSRMTEV
jgi:hypothetical protein